MTIIYESLSEEGDIGPFVSNEILWFKYKLCPLKFCFFLLFAFDMGIICLIGMLSNHCKK